MNEDPSLPSDKPTPCACEAANKEPSRRDFLLLIGMGLNVVAGTLIAIPLVGYVLSSFFQPNKLSWISLGSLAAFPVGTTRLAQYSNPVKRAWDGDTAVIPCWVRHIEAEKFQVFAINCSHLGCPVRWFEESRLFMCPCHGGVYYEDGGRAAGPPPRGLYTYPVKVENGELFIQGGALPNLSNQTA